ncbi:DNA polymerase III subunit beta [Candidatus Saccharibacteria bacterium 32-45-3]|nr:MAG: DNA polymerase III subunit beta [Candidatus Saccharibacteria bacterium 32-45-3]
MTGVLCHTADGALYLAATDGYRLAERKLLDTKAELRALIPATALNEASRVIPDDCDEVVMSFDDSQVRFEMQDIAITSRLIEGNYPDYRQLIPKETDITAVASRQELMRITKIASLFARESGGSITIHTDESKGLVSIHSIASQLGENTSETEAEVNAEGSITLNSRYLIEALNCFEGDTIRFGFSGKLAPCVLRGVSKTDEYQHIVMPLRS